MELVLAIYKSQKEGAPVRLPLLFVLLRRYGGGVLTLFARRSAEGFMDGYFVHESSFVDDGATVGAGTRIWHFCHIQSGK